MRFIAFVLLAGCATANPLKVAEAPGQYPAPIGNAQWAYTKFGFYLARDTAFDNPISYKALYDNRANKQALMEQYQATDDFKAYYPAFIKHTGTVDCEKGQNNATIEQYDGNMRRLLSSRTTEANEVSKNLCKLLPH